MTWNTLPTWTDLQVPTAADLNKYIQNAEHLHLPVVASFQSFGASLTTTATTWANIAAGFSLNIDTYGGRVLAILSCLGTNVQLDISLDGTRLGTAGASGEGAMNIANTPLQQMSLAHMFLPAAGNHTFAAMWRAVSGTATIRADAVAANFYLVKMRGG